MTFEIKKYYLFIDESGDHGLIKLDPSFPVFLLCGSLISDIDYNLLNQKIDEIKNHFWGNNKIIFHSTDIRKCQKEFQIFLNNEVKNEFYRDINNLVKENNYRIVASAIDKVKYINKYGKLSDSNVYELALSFIIERTIFCLDEIKNLSKHLEIIIEKRGKKEDKKLDEHFQRLLSRGTAYITSERLKELKIKITFQDKKQNNNGLQLTDLLAYPIARYVIDQRKTNLAFEILSEKIYIKNGKRYGLKIFP